MLPQIKPASSFGKKIIEKSYCVKNTTKKDEKVCLESETNNTKACIFVDLLNNKTWQAIKEEMLQLNQNYPFDGLWIRQDSPYTTCDGYCKEKPKSEPNYDDVKFPNGIRTKTIPLEGTYSYSVNSTYFNVYNMYPTLNALAVSMAAEESVVMKLRVTSSVASPRLSSYSTLWRGNVGSAQSTLNKIIAETISFNMAGMIFVGYPVCGYNNMPIDFCIRWYQMAAYLPEMRVFHDGTDAKEPIQLKDKPQVVEAVRSRYRIIRYLYSKVYESGIWGGSVWMPLTFQFPNDDNCLEDWVISNTFMIGSSLYVAPVIEFYRKSIKVYFPNSHWYTLKDFKLLVKYEPSGTGEIRELDTPLSDINVFIKGGSIIPIQDEQVQNTEELSAKAVTLVVAPDHNKKANGTMVVSNEALNLHNHYSFTYINETFRVNTIEGFTYKTNVGSDVFKEIIILDESLKKTSYACMVTERLELVEVNVSFNEKYLKLSAKAGAQILLYEIDSITFGSDPSKSLCTRTTSITEKKVEADGKSAKLTFDSAGTKYSGSFRLVTDEILYVAVEPAATVGKNWKVPDVLEKGVREDINATNKLTDFGVSINEVNSAFGFKINKGNTTVLQLQRDIIIEGDRFMKLDLDIACRRFYGLGERITEFELGDGVYSLFSKGVGNPLETRTRPGKNMYGAHPFYLFHIDGENFAAVFILSSNPMDVWLKSTSQTMKRVVHAIGSPVLELFYFKSNKPNELIVNYHSIIGKPLLVPYWAFGYHQSRWGYDTQEKLQEVVKKFDEKGIPLDVLWSDIDYMYKYQDFTLDESRFPNMAQFIKSLKTNSTYYVPILDAGIARNKSYKAYVDGLEKNVFIKSSHTKEPLVGIVWPGYAVFTDFTHSSAEAYWSEHIKELEALVHMDGLWLDMNEPTNFCDGECPDELHYAGREFTTDKDDMLIYSFGHVRLNDKVLSMDALHSDSSSEYDRHSMYGFYMIKAANKYFAENKKRPFILSRSSHPGSGRYGTHWLGDNYALMSYMHYSLAGIYNFQMFGIPMVGADVCGFAYQVDMSLCLRWMEMGAFYPFFRNHKEIGSGEQEPYVNETLTKVTIYATKTRYRLFRYLYSQYFHVALYGGAFFTPLFWHFPNDPSAYNNNEKTFMIGSSLKVSPCFNANSQENEKSYFPSADWYDLFTGKKVLSAQEAGKELDIYCSYNPVVLNVHIRGGSIIPMGDESTTKLRLMLNLANPVNLIVVPSNNIAKGTIYYDDNEFDTINEKKYQTVTVSYANRVFTFSTAGTKFEYQYGDKLLRNVNVFNANSIGSVVSAVLESVEGTKMNINVNLDKTKDILSLSANKVITDIKTITLSDKIGDLEQMND